ncbi:Serine/threonine-protein kinase PrkC [Thalassoglobus neptunius]|uniref:non-specific serine/threonine protein kinase n=1 Tax=Thalassoglobus neptunius TaxID=1938619 RepID=A0A5C5X5J5_9PLAN|nr:serine/threonine-protein kinase [Thalassoglobus neptunius]TWT58200.1 Serine/threonine-protein kinase PrkC [Thalassoglobus neptunius]
MAESDSNLPDEQTNVDDTTSMPPSFSASGEMVPQTDSILDDFRLLRRLGKGGMAEVWLAEQESLKRNVALKLLRPDLTEDQTYVARFQAEAKAAAGLNHPNIVQVYTVGENHGQYFIAQEYVEGATLKSFIQKKGPLEPKLGLRIMRQVASALRSAAEKGIVHRDIKPENIMLNRKGEAKVADFGLAQLQGGERLNLTQEGVTMGTPLYMSPEQVSGRKLDQRSDIYSFGITSYYMFAGHPPFEGENAVSVAVKHLHETPTPLEEIRPDLPKVICQVINRMTEKSPDDRYASAEDVLNDVRKIAKALETGDSVNDLFADSAPSANAFPTNRPAAVLTLLCILAALASAGVSLATRQTIPEANPNLIHSSIPKMDSAREQFIDAMFRVDSEDAFKAVIQYHPTDTGYVNRAHEQLALQYLHDPNRKADAERQLNLLRDIQTEEYITKARIGKAYLSAIEGNISLAKSTLAALPADYQDRLSESWRQREEDARRIISESEESSQNRVPEDSSS